MIKKFAEAVIRFRLFFLIIILGITAFFGYHAAKIVIQTNYDDQLPTDHPFREIHEKYKDALGGHHMVMMMLKVKEGTIFTIPTLKKIERAQYFLDGLTGVNHYQVISLASPKVKQVFIESGGGLTFAAIMRDVPKNDEEIEALIEAAHANDAVFGPLISFDDKCALITANFLAGKFDYDDIFSQVNKLVEFTANALLKIQALDSAENEQQEEEAIAEINKLPEEFFEMRKEFERVYGKTRILTKPENYILDQDHHVHLANQTISFDWQFYAEILLMAQIDKEW